MEGYETSIAPGNLSIGLAVGVAGVAGNSAMYFGVADGRVAVVEGSGGNCSEVGGSLSEVPSWTWQVNDLDTSFALDSAEELSPSDVLFVQARAFVTHFAGTDFGTHSVGIGRTAVCTVASPVVSVLLLYGSSHCDVSALRVGHYTPVRHC